MDYLGRSWAKDHDTFSKQRDEHLQATDPLYAESVLRWSQRKIDPDYFKNLPPSPPSAAQLQQEYIEKLEDKLEQYKVALECIAYNEEEWHSAQIAIDVLGYDPNEDCEEDDE